MEDDTKPMCAKPPLQQENQTPSIIKATTESDHWATVTDQLDKLRYLTVFLRTGWPLTQIVQLRCLCSANTVWCPNTTSVLLYIGIVCMHLTNKVTHSWQPWRNPGQGLWQRQSHHFLICPEIALSTAGPTAAGNSREEATLHTKANYSCLCLPRVAPCPRQVLQQHTFTLVAQWLLVWLATASLA